MEKELKHYNYSKIEFKKLIKKKLLKNLMKNINKVYFKIILNHNKKMKIVLTIIYLNQEHL